MEEWILSSDVNTLQTGLHHQPVGVEEHPGGQDVSPVTVGEVSHNGVAEVVTVNT